MSGNQKPASGWCLFFLSVLFALICAFSGCAAADEVKNPLAIDLVIAIDNNIRMNNSNLQKDTQLDPDGLRFDAAATLINMCDAKYSRAGFFLFNNDLYKFDETNGSNFSQITSDELALFNISLPTYRPQRQNLMNTLNNNKLRNAVGKGGSDIGKALAAAVDLEIRNKNNGNRKVILLLTADNKNTSAASKQKAVEAHNKAVENGIDIYAVAIKEGSAVLQSLATKPENYQLVANVDDLVDVCRTFFADMVGSTPDHTGSPVTLQDGRKEIKLEIPNESVSEVNLIIPLKKMDELDLYSGNKIIKKTDDSVLTNQSSNICTYKLISPSADTYYLRYATDSERDIVIQYVFSYSVQAVASVEKQEISKHLPVRIAAGYLDNGEPTKDGKLYNIPATISLWKGKQQIIPEQKMSMNKNGNGYYVEYSSLQQYGAGEYTAKVKFDGDGLLRESEVTFTLINDAPGLIDKNRKGDNYNVTINEPGKADTYDAGKFTRQWDLSQFVNDINGDALHAEILQLPDDVDVHCDGMALSVTPKKNKSASGNIVLIVKDTDGAQSGELVFPVKVVNYEDRYKRYTARFDPVTNLAKNSSQKITLRVYNQEGVAVKDDNKHFPDKVKAVVNSGFGQREIILSITKDGSWEGDLATGITTAEYTVDAEIIISDQVKIKAEQLSVSSVNRAPELKPGAEQTNNWILTINDPGNPSSYEVKTQKWALLDLVKDPDGDDLTFEVDEKASIDDVVITYTKENKELTLTTKVDQEADGDIVIHCWDNEHRAGPDLTFHVKVDSLEELYRQYSASFKASGHGKNMDVTIDLSVLNNEGILVQQDSNLPDTVEASYTLDGVQTALNLIREEDGKWRGTFHTADKEVVYTIKAQVPISQNVSIVPEDLRISTENTPPYVVKEINQEEKIPETIQIEPFLLWNQDTGEIVFNDLNEFFKDDDGDELVFGFGNNDLGEFADATIEGNKLTINGLKETAKALGFTVIATDNEGQQAASKPIQFTVKSLQKQGITTILLAIAAVIALIILYNIFKPGFHDQFFEVSTKKDGGVALPQGKSGYLKGKKPVALGNYSTAYARDVCDSSIPTSLLNTITLAPAYGNRVKCKLSDNTTAKVRIGSDIIDKKKGGAVSPDGKITVEQNGTSIIFQLKKAGSSVAPQGMNHNTVPGKPATTRTSARTKSKSSSHT